MQDTTRPRLDDGLSPRELEGHARRLLEAPERGLIGFETRTTWLGGLRSRGAAALEIAGQRVERRHLVAADAPAALHGDDTAPSPEELLLAAVGASLTAAYALQAALLGVELRSLRVELRGTLDLRAMFGGADAPSGFPEVSCRVFVDADAHPEQLRAVHARALATSPGYQHLLREMPARTQLIIER